MSFHVCNDLLNMSTDFKLFELKNARITVKNLEGVDKLNFTIYSGFTKRFSEMRILLVNLSGWRTSMTAVMKNVQ